MRKFGYFCSVIGLNCYMKNFLLTVIMMCAVSSISHAQTPLKLGLRAGLNISNITERHVSVGSLVDNAENWGKGFVIGAVVDIPLSRYFALQPGFFYDRRTADFAASFTQDVQTENGTISSLIHDEGTTTTNWFHVPMLVSYKFSPVKEFGIHLELGPYIALGVAGTCKYSNALVDGDAIATEVQEISVSAFKGDDALYFDTDWGFKAGGGILLFEHYYLGAHYLFGLRNLAKNKQLVSKSHTREWQFTLGYNF